MFRWSFIFLGMAMVAASFGYQKTPTTFSNIAKLLFFACLFIFLAYLVVCIFSTTPQQSSTGLPTP